MDQIEKPDENREASYSSYGIDCFSKPWPIVFSVKYDIHHWLTRFHPFDAKKWGRTYSLLEKKIVGLKDRGCFEPEEISDEQLLKVHTERYLDSLKSPCVVARVLEVPPVACLLKASIKEKLLRPLRFQTAGTLMAAHIAMGRGCGINLGGGFHHCSGDRGMGFCAFADITLALWSLLESGVRRAMIIDLDAHQGNGYARDFMGDERVYILDVFNREIYPGDRFAKKAIRRCVELTCGTRDDTFLRKVRIHVNQALDEFQPDVVLYVAGTDVLKDDPLGCLSISPDGVVNRDEIVFEECRRPKSRNPTNIFMTTAGGYQRSNASVIANSIENLVEKGLLD